MSVVRVYPIRPSKRKWTIPLYSRHVCNEYCKYTIQGNFFERKQSFSNPEFENLVIVKTDKKCEREGKLEKVCIRLLNPKFSQLYNPDMQVIFDNYFSIEINFPLTNAIDLMVKSDSNKPFTLKEIIKVIRAIYKNIYDIEEQTSTRIRYTFKRKCFECGEIDFEILSEKDLNEKECSICYGYFENRENVKLKCNHVYHKDCMVEWCSKSKTCPICREKLIDCENCGGNGYLVENFETATVPVELRERVLIRNTTDGIFGIHTWDLENLILEKIVYDRIKKRLYVSMIN
jgi:hypothetical protein